MKDFSIIWVAVDIWYFEIHYLCFIQYLDIIELSAECLAPFENNSLEVLVTDKVYIFKERRLFLNKIIKLIEEVQIRVVNTAFDFG